MRRFRSIPLLTILASLLALTSSGCITSWLYRRDSKASQFITSDRLDHGKTIVLPGIEGQGPLNIAIRDGLVEGGVPTAVEIHEWTMGVTMAWLSEMLEGRARQKAEDLAVEIHSYRIQHPGKPVVLVGHSGGCAVAIFALEKLPPSVNVDSVILLGPSLSMDYNLGPALRHVDGQVYSYYSSKDSALLGAGTFIFGTMDGKHASAAGRYGFTVPAAEKDLYAKKLKQIPWDRDMAMAGNNGGHTDWASKTFVREYIARQVMAELTAHDQRIKLAAAASTRPDNLWITYYPEAARPRELKAIDYPPATQPGATTAKSKAIPAASYILPSSPH